eukprot:TRINITY_DN1123_c0_g2_i1.p1 TRINITY_DN1123_c0_g2~~TRINITY_DN1123_c0_g2_i1.p1  ORF type:complete len:489 (-),score=73.88 TRINITY_DN1123_c0_g2_i1:25-1491(-)
MKALFVLVVALTTAVVSAWFWPPVPPVKYDVVVNVASLPDFKDGFAVEIANHTRYNEMSQKDVHVVGVIGRFKQGKSWILGKLSKLQIPNDPVVPTLGFSVKFSEDKEANFLWLDTPGTDVASNAKDIEARPATDAFVRDATITMADSFVVVANRLHFADQQMLQFISRKDHRVRVDAQGRVVSVAQPVPKSSGASESEKLPYILVVHNFFHLTTLEQVAEAVMTDIVRVFGAQETDQSIDVDGKLKSVRFYKSARFLHFVLAKEGSVAGEAYNSDTFAAIKTKLVGAQLKRGEFGKRNLVDEIARCLTRFRPEYFPKAGADVTAKVVHDPSTNEDKIVPSRSTDNFAVPWYYWDHPDGRLISFVSPDSFIAWVDVIDAPPDRVIVKLDVPGFALSDIKLNVRSDRPEIISIEGARSDEHELGDHANRGIEFSVQERRHGKFSLRLQLPHYVQLLLSLHTFSLQDGVFTAELKRMCPANLASCDDIRT